MAIEKRRVGDALEIKADEWNEIEGMVRQGKSARKIATRLAAKHLRSSTIFYVKNNSGADRDRFDVLGIDGMLYEQTDNANEFKANPTFKGVAPTYAQHLGRYVVLLEPLKAGKIGRCVVAGVTVAKISMLQSTHTRAEIIDSNPAKLQSTASGSAKILWVESGIGDKWAVVQLDTARGILLFELTAPLVLGGQAAAQVLRYDIGSAAFVKDGPTITVGDPSIVSGHKFGGPAGFRGACAMHRSGSTGAHEILWLEHYARIISASLTANVSGGGSGGAGGTAAGTVSGWTDGRQPPSSVLVVDKCGRYSDTKAGECVMAHIDTVTSSAALWATLTYVALDGPGKSKIKVGAGCNDLTGNWAQTESTTADEIKVRKNSALRLWHNTQASAGQNVAYIDIGGAPEKTLYAQPDATGVPKFDPSPVVTSIEGETFVRAGNVALCRPSGTVFLQSWALPKAQPIYGGRLYAESTSGGCAQLEWESPGLTTSGYMYFHESDDDDCGTCLAVSFRRGLLISIEGVQDSAPANPGQPVCNTTEGEPFDPCATPEQ